MITVEALIRGLTRNAEYIHTHLAGLTHVEALAQPPARGNCILWILGHIVCYRNYALNALGQPKVIADDAARRFERGSSAVLGDEPGLPLLEDLLWAYDDSQVGVFAALRALTAEVAVEVVTEGDFTLPRAELIVTYMRHESYHSGQFELLREIVLERR
ncbi:MAG: DinB family protein [Anaerolineales bacterium]